MTVRSCPFDRPRVLWSWVPRTEMISGPVSVARQAASGAASRVTSVIGYWQWGPIPGNGRLEGPAEWTDSMPPRDRRAGPSPSPPKQGGVAEYHSFSLRSVRRTGSRSATGIEPDNGHHPKHRRPAPPATVEGHHPHRSGPPLRSLARHDLHPRTRNPPRRRPRQHLPRLAHRRLTANRSINAAGERPANTEPDNPTGTLSVDPSYGSGHQPDGARRAWIGGQPFTGTSNMGDVPVSVK